MNRLYSVGNPVNFITGNKYQEEIDLFPQSSGLEIVRYYNSRNPRVHVLGQGWSLSFDEHLYKNSGSMIQLVLGDGQRVTFGAVIDDRAFSSKGVLLLTRDKDYFVEYAYEFLIHEFDQRGDLIRLIAVPDGSLTLPQILAYLADAKTEKILAKFDEHKTLHSSAEVHEYMEMDERKTSKGIDSSEVVKRSSVGEHRNKTGVDSSAEVHEYTEVAERENSKGIDSSEVFKHSSVGEHRNKTDADSSAEVHEYREVADRENSKGIDSSEVVKRSSVGEHRNKTGVDSSAEVHEYTEVADRENKYLVLKKENTETKLDVKESVFSSFKQLVIERNSLGFITAIRSLSQPEQSLSFHYQRDGFLSRIVRDDGFFVNYVYEGSLLQSANLNDRFKLVYVYKDGYLHQRYIQDLEKKDRIHLLGTWFYDDKGRVTFYDGLMERFSFSYENQLTRMVDRFGRSYEVAYERTKDHYRITKNDLSKAKDVQVPNYSVGAYPYARIEEGILVFKNGVKQFVRNNEHFLYDANDRLLWHSLVLQDAQERVDQVVQYFQPVSLVSSLVLAYNPKSQLMASNFNGEIKTYEWRENGLNKEFSVSLNAQGLVEKDEDKHYRYTTDKRLSGISDGQEVLVKYEYGFDEKLKSYVRYKYILDDDRYELIQKLYFDDGKILYEWDKEVDPKEEFAITRQYIWQGKAPIALIDFSYDEPKVFYIHVNHLMAPIAVTNEKAEVVWLAQYDALANADILKSDISLHLRLPGQYYDEESGLHFNHYRYYDSYAGHFLEPDPVKGLPLGSTYGFADYYQGKYVDPLGMYLIAFDGTSVTEKYNSNVRQLYDEYDHDKTYLTGAGTNPVSGILRVVNAALGLNAVNKVASAFFNLRRYLSDIQKKRKEMQDHHTHRLFENIIVPIDIVGFSRGGVQSMLLAYLLSYVTNNGLFKYKDTNFDIEMCLDLRFVGMFDAVAQMPETKYRLSRMDPETSKMKDKEIILHKEIPQSWKWVAHAVALNERNNHLPLTPLASSSTNGNVRNQAGFIGAHGDIGGGYNENDKKHKNRKFTNNEYSDLAVVAKSWIHWQARQAGVPFKEPSEESRQVKNPIAHRSNLSAFLSIADDDEDRDVEFGDKKIKQGEVESIGEAKRKEVSAFIEYIDKDQGNGAIMGKVDMEKYREWLKKEYDGFDF
ncbi:DUF6531 domain-containing protein [Basilea psittacipulmonis]|uniref:DUF6531 domain-containing protein n=1 Tax=Basilea psittacipulmonis TaxID=1472345 RepID=UPI001F359B93|nr:DUF6531 domain-containing protein [Basilea psittacipulmonis]